MGFLCRSPLALVLGGLVLACGTPGSRAGSGGFLGFGKAFPDLNLQLAASNITRDGGFQVIVQLFLASDSPDHCFVAPPDLRVSVNGRALALQSAGGTAAPEMFSGVEVHIAHCRPARFVSMGEPFVVDREEAHVLVEQRGKNAEMLVRTFFRPRSFEVLPAVNVRPGQRVSLKWQEASDEWRGYDASTWVEIWRDDKFIAKVEKSQGLSSEDGHIDFVFPQVAPGPARLQTCLASLEALPRVDGCRGFHRCEASLPHGLPGPKRPIVITVSGD